MKVIINGIEIERRIVGLDKTRGQIVVEWSNEDFPEGFTVAVDLPIINGRVPEGEELDAYLRGFCPIAEFERAKALKSSTLDLSHIEAMVEARAGSTQKTAPDEGIPAI